MELKQQMSFLESLRNLTFNRTLWNWNLRTYSAVYCSHILLIVPYGIETSTSMFATDWLLILLIVPYGIETSWQLVSSQCCCLLIVPYGIETPHFLLCDDAVFLLIVPYGIETSALSSAISSFKTFNRTLWNWNTKTRTLDTLSNILLIVPYGIETKFRYIVNMCFLDF